MLELTDKARIVNNRVDSYFKFGDSRAYRYNNEVQYQPWTSFIPQRTTDSFCFANANTSDRFYCNDAETPITIRKGYPVGRHRVCVILRCRYLYIYISIDIYIHTFIYICIF